MNKESGGFTFGFATVTVVIVAVLLSVAAIGLAPFQERNVRLEKMQNILSSFGIDAQPQDAEKIFNQYVKQQVVLDTKGKQVTGQVSAFDIDLKKEQDKVKTGQADKQQFPLFVVDKEGERIYVIPVRGKGLWGPIWGYIALKEDMNTIHGVSFDHKGETPGLGAEINTPSFEQQFVGEKIFDDAGNFVSIKVIKGGTPRENIHGVDGISGGTVTSNGVSEMLERTLSYYVPFFKEKKKQLPESNEETKK